MRLMRCSVPGLVDSIPLDDLDGSIRSLGCLETLQASMVMFGSSASDQFQNGGIAFQSLFSLFQPLDSIRPLWSNLCSAFLPEAGAAGRALAIAPSALGLDCRETLRGMSCSFDLRL
jgi:hypothetical protein